MNLQNGAYGLVPPTFFALTRQKYMVLFARPLKFFDVSVTVESFKTKPLTKLESIVTCTRYEEARAAAFQRNVIDVG